MTIEIHQPELEAMIEQRMASGRFESVEDVLMAALRATPDMANLKTSSTQERSFTELFEPAQGLLTDEEVDTLFRRDSSSGRSIDLS